MSADEPTPPEAGQWAAGVAATAAHISTVVSVLRELDFGDTPPAPAYHAETHDAAV